METNAEVTDRVIEQVFAMGSEEKSIALISLVKESFYTYLSLVLAFFSHSSVEIDKSLDLVLRRKAIVYEALAARRDNILIASYPLLKSKIDELNILRAQIVRSYLSTINLQYPNIPSNDLEEKKNRVEILERELSSQIQEFSFKKRVERRNRDTISNMLKADEVLIDFIKIRIADSIREKLSIASDTMTKTSTFRYLAFVIHSKGFNDVKMVDLGDADRIDGLIIEFIRLLSQNAINEPSKAFNHIQQPDENTLNKGYELRMAVFDQLISFLADCHKIYLCPDGVLSLLPFEVLPMNNLNRYLIDEYQIVYLSSSHDIPGFIATTQSYNKPLVAVDPDFDLALTPASSHIILQNKKQSSGLQTLDQNVIHFNSLSGTRIEGEIISDLLNISPWSGNEVLTHRVKEYKSPRILHIATHGFFLSSRNYPFDTDINSTLLNLSRSGMINVSSWKKLKNPLLRSGLALAGANTWAQGGMVTEETEDGILTAADVTGMDLINTELVVLSACDTALGEILVGEGVFGLRRSFSLAGAQTLVMSMWKVPDKQTLELMVNFYRRLKKGQGRADALREAQKEIKKKYPHPYYWGAFICQGNPGRLQGIA
jgi:CHAT domain-containing protein